VLLSLPVEHPHCATFEQIRQAGEKASRLIRQLIAFNRQQVLQPKVLDLNAVVANIDTMLQRVIGEDIDLLTILSPGLASVKADPGQIEQVLMNLVLNARDAMPNGGRLTIETADVVLDTDYARTHVAVNPGRYVMLAVSDNGCGMDAETQARIFEPFFTTKDLGKGTGLGLSTALGIVRGHGGFVEVSSEPGQGTVMKVYLPANADSAAATDLERKSELLLTGDGETIMVVDDETVILDVTKQTLESYGYNVITAIDGAEAIAQYALRHSEIAVV